MFVYILTNIAMTRTLELSEETHANFLKLKSAIEDMAGEKVSNDQVVDFMIRSMLNAVELPDEEMDGCACCGHGDHHHDHHHHHHCGCEEDACECDHHHEHHHHHHCDCEEDACGCDHHHEHHHHHHCDCEEDCQCKDQEGKCNCGDECECDDDHHCGCKTH